MDREVTVRYTPELIRFAVRRFWARSIGWGGFFSFALVLTAFVYFFVIGDRSWWLGFFGTVAGLCVLLGVVSYRIYLGRSMEKFNRMGEALAKFHFTDERIGIESDIGWTELSWKMIEKVWTYPHVWLVFIAKQGYVTLPVGSLDDELKKFILVSVEKTGGRVI